MSIATSGPRAADDAAGRGVDVDPDYTAVLHELEPVGAAVELRPEIIGPAHERHDPALELGKRHGAALLRRFERALLLPHWAVLLLLLPHRTIGFGTGLAVARPVGQRGRAGQAGGHDSREKGTQYGHEHDSRGTGF